MTPPNHPNPHVAHLSTVERVQHVLPLNADPFVPESVREAGYILGYTLNKLHAAPPRDLTAPPSLPDLVRMLLGVLVERLSPEIAASLGAHNIPAYDADLGIVVAQVEVARTEAQRALEESEKKAKDLKSSNESYASVNKAAHDQIAALHEELSALRNKARRARKIERGTKKVDAAFRKARQAAEASQKKEGRR